MWMMNEAGGRFPRGGVRREADHGRKSQRDTVQWWCDQGSKGLKEEVAKKVKGEGEKEKAGHNGPFPFLLLIYFLMLLSI